MLMDGLMDGLCLLIGNLVCHCCCFVEGHFDQLCLMMRIEIENSFDKPIVIFFYTRFDHW